MKNNKLWRYAFLTSLVLACSWVFLLIAPPSASAASNPYGLPRSYSDGSDDCDRSAAVGAYTINKSYWSDSSGHPLSNPVTISGSSVRVYVWSESYLCDTTNGTPANITYGAPQSPDPYSGYCPDSVPASEPACKMPTGKAVVSVSSGTVKGIPSPFVLGSLSYKGDSASGSLGYIDFAPGTYTGNICYKVGAKYPSISTNQGCTPLQAITIVSPNHTPSGYINYSCNPDGTAHVYWHYTDSDGPSNNTFAASQTSGDANPVGPYTGAQLRAYGWNTFLPLARSYNENNIRADGTVFAYLAVYDYGSILTSDNLYHYDSATDKVNIKCNKPTGKVLVACELAADGVTKTGKAILKFSYSDVDAPGDASQAYYGVSSTPPGRTSYQHSAIASFPKYHYLTWGKGNDADPGDPSAVVTADPTQTVYLFVRDYSPNYPTDTEAYYDEQTPVDIPSCVNTGSPPTCSAVHGLEAPIPVASASPSITLKIDLNGGPLPAPVPNFTYAVKDLATTPAVTVTSGSVGAASDGSGGVQSTAPITVPTNTSGNYRLEYVWNGQDCPTDYRIGYAPYFSVKGGDAAAGAGIGSGCSVTNPADITSWNNDNYPTGTGYAGAGSLLAALATGDIKHYATSQVTTPTDPSALAFANSPPASYSGTIYGGKLDNLPCEPDYYGTPPAVPSLPSAALTVGSPPTSTVSVTNFAALSGAADANKEKVYNRTGDLAIGNFTSDMTLTSGQIITIHVKGNVYINSNILYSYGDLQHVPRLNIYAQGAIFISDKLAPFPGVSELHGLYVAQSSNPDPTKHQGLFATCYDATRFTTSFGNTTADPETTQTDSCNTPLTVYGSVVAKDVHLNRSHGSLYPSGSVLAEPAETFEYSPELWLSGNVDCATTSGATGCSKYNAISGLPPVL